MPCTDYARVIFVIECGAPEVNKIDVWRQQDSPELRAPCGQGTARRDVPVVGEGLVGVTQEQNVLRFEIGMDEVEVVQKGDGSKELPRESLDVRTRERHEAGRLEKVENAEAEQRRDDADVASPIEAVPKLNAAVAVVGIGSLECLQDAKLNATSITIL